MSKDLGITIQTAEEIFNKIKRWMEEGQVEGELSDRIIASYVLIVMNHYDSIINLTKSGHHISASALARPLYEAYIRATWISSNITTTEVKKALKDLTKGRDNFPSLWEMTKAIDTSLKVDSFYKMQGYIIGAFNNYTHGGTHLISRCLGEEKIAPHFEVEDIMGGLQGASYNALFAVLAFASHTKNDTLASNINKELHKLASQIKDEE